MIDSRDAAAFPISHCSEPTARRAPACERRANTRSLRPSARAAASFAVVFAASCGFGIRTSAAGAVETRDVDIGRGVKLLAKDHPSATAQKKLLDDAIGEATRALPWFGPTPVTGTDSYYPSLASAATTLATKRDVTANSFGDIHFAGAVEDAPLDARSIRYEFGSRGLRLLKDGVPQKTKTGLVGAADGKLLSPIVRLAWLEQGISPDAELILAALERDLDVDRGADDLVQYLEYWRNADESFYEALDRTAGSPDGVFHYDIMLEGYAAKFFSKDERKKKEYLSNPHDWSHDRFHESFLTARKYRGLIESVALSLVLPPDVALPTRLSRYDFSAVSGTALSVRDQVLILLADANGDVAKVVAFVGKVLEDHHMPAELWTKDSYDPVNALAERVIAEVDVPTVATRGWTTEWAGDATLFNRHYDVAVAYREFRTKRATELRTTVKARLGSP